MADQNASNEAAARPDAPRWSERRMVWPATPRRPGQPPVYRGPTRQDLNQGDRSRSDLIEIDAEAE